MIINKTTYEVQTMSTHPDDNWMGGEWAIVPENLHAKAKELAPYCILIWNGGELTGIEDSGTRPEIVAEPTAEELLNLILGGTDNE